MFIKICLTFYLQAVFILSIEFCHLHPLLDSDISVIIWLRNYSYILPAGAYYVNNYLLFFSILYFFFTFKVNFKYVGVFFTHSLYELLLLSGHLNP